jgi:hypothetical protein
LLDYSDHDPIRKDITVIRGSNSSPFPGVAVHYVSGEQVFSDVIEVKTPQGHTAKCYYIESTLIDLLQNRPSIGPALLSAALKRYASSSRRRLPKLIEIGKSFRVDKLLETYLKVLL